jgi:hypothetical protein
MNSIQKFALLAFLFLLGFIIVNYSSCKSMIESYGGHGGGGRGRGGIGRGGYYGGRGGYYGGRGGYYGGRGGYYGGYGYNPVYIYNDSNYGYSYPYWYRYIPFLNSYY